MTVKDELHRLVDELPEGEAHAALRFLAYLRSVGSDLVLRAFLEAPEDDEPLTPEDEAAVREGEDQLARGERIPLEVVIERHRQVS